VLMLSGATVGNWIDSKERLKAARTFLIIQNVSVAVNCFMLAAYFNWKDEALNNFGEWVTPLAAVLTILINLVSSISSAGSKIVVEKDWIVTIANGDEERLAKMNSIFRTIDLICLTVAPALAGYIFSYTSYVITAITIGFWNICSVVFEYILLCSIYKQYSALSLKSLEKEQGKTEHSNIGERVKHSYRGWAFYMRHKVRNAGLGLAFLYMTVLGFDLITWAYALLQCVSEAVLGVLVMVSAIVGIVGSISFPLLRRKIGKEKAGLVGMTSLVASLSVCVVSVWLPGSPFDPWNSESENSEIFEEGSGMVPEEEAEMKLKSCPTEKTSVIVLLTGIILARFGLWISDLSITQILQENVEERKRGVIGGVQNSLNQGFNLLKFILVIMMPDEHMFGFLVIISFTFICFGAISFTCYALKQGEFCCQSRSKTDYVQAKTTEQSVEMATVI